MRKTWWGIPVALFALGMGWAAVAQDKPGDLPGDLPGDPQTITEEKSKEVGCHVDCDGAVFPEDCIADCTITWKWRTTRPAATMAACTEPGLLLAISRPGMLDAFRTVPLRLEHLTGRGHVLGALEFAGRLVPVPERPGLEGMASFEIVPLEGGEPLRSFLTEAPERAVALRARCAIPLAARGLEAHGSVRVAGLARCREDAWLLQTRVFSW